MDYKLLYSSCPFKNSAKTVVIYSYVNSCQKYWITSGDNVFLMSKWMWNVEESYHIANQLHIYFSPTTMDVQSAGYHYLIMIM